MASLGLTPKARLSRTGSEPVGATADGSAGASSSSAGAGSSAGSVSSSNAGGVRAGRLRGRASVPTLDPLPEGDSPTLSPPVPRGAASVHTGMAAPDTPHASAQGAVEAEPPQPAGGVPAHLAVPQQMGAPGSPARPLTAVADPDSPGSRALSHDESIIKRRAAALLRRMSHTAEADDDYSS